MSGELVVRPADDAVLSNEQLQYIARTEFVGPGLRGNVPAILACVATGRALGLADMVSLRSIHVIDGKATFSAELMVMLVRRAGHSITGESSEGKAVARGRRADNGDEMTVTWTLAMAERAGLAGRANWKRYPESMLWARAVSQLCRMLFADCFAGATYTTEELSDTVEAVPVEDDNLFPPLEEPAPNEARHADALDGDPASVEPSSAGSSSGAEASAPEEVEPAAIPAPDEASNPPLPAPAQDGSGAEQPVISEAQRKRLHAIRNRHGVTEQRAKELVLEITGQDSTAAIPRGALYDAVIAALQAEPEPESEFKIPPGAAA